MPKYRVLCNVHKMVNLFVEAETPQAAYDQVTGAESAELLALPWTDSTDDWRDCPENVDEVVSVHSEEGDDLEWTAEELADAANNRDVTYRVEATIPAIQHVVARTAQAAIEKAVAHPQDWEVDFTCEITEDHIEDVEQEEDDDDDDEPSTEIELKVEKE